MADQRKHGTGRGGRRRTTSRDGVEKIAPGAEAPVRAPRGETAAVGDRRYEADRAATPGDSGRREVRRDAYRETAPAREEDDDVHRYDRDAADDHSDHLDSDRDDEDRQWSEARDRDRDRDRPRENARDGERPSRPLEPRRGADDDGIAAAGRREARVIPTEEEYQLTVQFDRATRSFTGTAIEFPEIKITAHTREQAFEQLVDAVDSETEIRRRRNEPLPEPSALWHFPETIEVRISSAVYRRLDQLSKQERMPIEQLAAEMVNTGATLRYEALARSGGNKNDHRDNNRGENRGNNARGHHGGGGQQHKGGGGRRTNRNFHQTMESGENFLEYVRSLEKGGGGAAGGGRGGGNWRNKK